MKSIGLRDGENALSAWKFIKDSVCEESALGEKHGTDKSFEELIHAHNLAPTFDEHVQILSIVADTTPFHTLNEYNPKDVRDNFREEGNEDDNESKLEEAARLDETEENKSLEMSLNSAITGEIDKSNKSKKIPKAYFNPAVSRYKFRKARFHKRTSGAGRPYVKEKSSKWKLSSEILTSSEQMQSVAHGTLKITLDSGQKTREGHALYLDKGPFDIL